MKTNNCTCKNHQTDYIYIVQNLEENKSSSNSSYTTVWEDIQIVLIFIALFFILGFGFAFVIYGGVALIIIMAIYSIFEKITSFIKKMTI